MEIAKSNPFIDYDGDVNCYVTFLAEKPIHNPTLLIQMNQLENKVFKYDNNSVFTAGFNVKGRYGFQNVFIVKESGVPATTRNWNTLHKILK